MSAAGDFVEIEHAGSALRIEYRWSGPADGPLLVFLHEGLGSMSMWKDFPDRLCAATGMRGLVYSRPGYGRSTPRAPDEHWDVDFMHRQAHQVLPAVLAALGVDCDARPPWLFGHSDGASIALLYAARFPARLAGALVMAPHIMVEDLTVASIEQARLTYLETDLKQRLGRYHDDPDSAFWGWNDIWLKPEFRHWSIEEEIERIRCPLLALQGRDDEYGTLEQVYGIARCAPAARVVELPDCGHSPHRDRPLEVIEQAAMFFDSAAVVNAAPASACSAG